MLSAVSHMATMSRGWMANAVFALDERLRERESIYEYTDDPLCLFRIQLGTAERSFVMRDGVALRKGDPVIRLHIWNEHVPAMDATGPSVGWAREVVGRIEPSLRELERHLATRPECTDVVAICGDLTLGTPQQGAQLTRIVARYGFEVAKEIEPEPSFPSPRRIGENILMLLLVLAANPAAARLSILRRDRHPVYLSRRALQQFCTCPRRTSGKAGDRTA
jgi:hypothetical protein